MQSRLSVVALGVFLVCGGALGQGVIATLAGADPFFSPRAGAAITAPLREVSGLALDRDDNVYFCDRKSSVVLRVSQAGIYTVIAGNGFKGFSGDGGPAAAASLSDPTAVAVDAQGVVYIADRGNGRVRRVSRDGSIDTIAGGGTLSGTAGDGQPATTSQLSTVFGIAISTGGEVYISETAGRIRKFTPGGTMATVAGAGSSNEDGPASAARLTYPVHLAFDATGNLFFPDLRTQRLRRISPAGDLVTIAGNGTNGFGGDGGPATAAMLNNPAGVAIAIDGKVAIADVGNSRVRQVADGTISTIAGNGQLLVSNDLGLATEAGILLPTAVAYDSQGRLYIAAAGSHRIRRVRLTGAIEPFAGDGLSFSGPNGTPARDSPLNLSVNETCSPFQQVSGLSSVPTISVDRIGNVLFVEPSTNRVRFISPDGILGIVAGNGESGFSGDEGPASSARLSLPVAAVAGQGPAEGFVLVFDANNGRVRAIDFARTGIIRTVLTITGLESLIPFSLQLDGSLDSQNLIRFAASGVVDSAGNGYLAYGSQVLRIPPTGNVTRVAPDVLNQGFTNFPHLLAADREGNVYAVQKGFGFPSKLFRISATGMVTEITTTTPLGTITGIAVDPAGNLYLSDWGAHTILRLAPNGELIRVAGNGQCGNEGDGLPPLSASLDPRALTIDRSGNIYIISGDRIRVIPVTPPAFQISSTELTFAADSEGRPADPQTVTVVANANGVNFTTLVQPPAPWLALTPDSGSSPRLISISADPGTLAPGRYETNVTFTALDAVPSIRQLRVVFTVGTAKPIQLSVDQPSLTFQFPKTGAPRTTTLRLSNDGGGSAPIAAIALTRTGGRWLEVLPSASNITSRSPVPLRVTATPGSLPPGTYEGSIVITALASPGQPAPTPLDVSVTMLISDRDQVMLLTQTGISFLGVSGGGVVPPQSFGIANLGIGTLNWTTRTTTTSGGDWLKVSPAQGSTIAGQVVPSATATVDARSLQQGRYCGQIRVESPDAPNSPQVVTIFLQVLGPDENPGSVIQPTQLSFSAISGGSPPGSQDLLLYNLTNRPLRYVTQLVTLSGGNWLRYAPSDGTINPQSPSAIGMQPLVGDVRVGPLPPGEYQAKLAIQFSDGTVRDATITHVVRAPGASVDPAHRGADGVCAPTRLNSQWSSIGQASTVPAGWPAALVADVRDDCGDPLTSGSVTVSFSNGDPPLALMPLGDGTWNGTWNASGRGGQNVVLNLNADDPERQLRGTFATTALLFNQQDPPEFTLDKVVSVSAPMSFSALAPRGAISIFGSRLAAATVTNSAATLPETMGDALVVIGGSIAPLYYVSPGQINAVVPPDLAVNTTHYMVVTRGTTVSRPVPINLAATQPGLFNLEGAVLASVVRDTPQGRETFLVSPNARARAGDTVVFYATGLGGDLTQTPGAGSPAPSSPLAQLKTYPMLQIGGLDVPISFAGLTPGSVGLYQINAIVPEGVAKGPTVPVVLEAGGRSSPSVNIAIE